MTALPGHSAGKPGLVIATDIGRDPDDLFALLYLIEAGARLSAVAVEPGDPDQIAVVKFLLKECGLDVPVGAARRKGDKSSSSGIHPILLKKYGRPGRVSADGPGEAVMAAAFASEPGAELFVCGPPESTGRFLEKQTGIRIGRATIQGGFVSPEDVRAMGIAGPLLEKFRGCRTYKTFNLNTCPEGARRLLAADIGDRRFVSKNVCHAVEADAHAFARINGVKPRTRAGELFREALGLYLEKHGSKRFHDPVAAVLHLHPELGSWVVGDLYQDKGGWGTRINPQGASRVIGAIDEDAFWDRLALGT